MYDEASSLIYCNNIDESTKLMGNKYDGIEWGLFINSSNRSLKAVHLNNGNKFSSIPVALSVEMKETHNSMEHLLSALKCQEHKCLIYRDLKVVGLLLFVLVGLTTSMSDKSGYQYKD